MSGKIRHFFLIIGVILLGLFFVTIVSKVRAQDNTPDVDFPCILEQLLFGTCGNQNTDAPPSFAPGEELTPAVPKGTPPPLPTPDQYLNDWQQKMRVRCYALYELIAHSCQNYVTNTNGCYEKIRDDPLLKNKDASNEISFSIKNYVVLQCTRFVRACASLADSPFINGGTGDAKTFSTPPDGYRFITKGSEKKIPDDKIQIGDIPVWVAGTFGHVAVVINIESDNRFQVVEANLLDPGTKGTIYYQLHNGFVQTRPKNVYPPNNDPKQDPWAASLAGWLRKI